MSYNIPVGSSSNQPFQFMKNGQTKDFIKEKLDSNGWWILLLGDEWANKIATQIEQQHFLGLDVNGQDRNADLELFQAVDGFMNILLCKKSRLSSKALAKIINRHVGFRAADKKALSKKSIIGLAASEVLSGVLQAAFLLWISGKSPRNPRWNPSMN